MAGRVRRAGRPAPRSGETGSSTSARIGETRSSSTTRTGPKTCRWTGRPPGHHGPRGDVPGPELHLGPDQDQGPVREDRRALRGPHQSPARPGDLARVLAAGRQLRRGGLAGLRRDRHHGIPRPGAQRRFTAASTGRATPAAVPPSRGASYRRIPLSSRLPRVRGRVGRRLHSPGSSTASVSRRSRQRPAPRRPLGVRPSVLHSSSTSRSAETFVATPTRAPRFRRPCS